MPPIHNLSAEGLRLSDASSNRDPHAATEVDQILELQLAVAWAGEGDTEPPRLGWWRTALCDEYAGEDLLKRLLPRTWAWALLESVRAAARRVDERMRQRADDPDHFVTLFRLGFETDERLDERLLELKQSGEGLSQSFPSLGALLGGWAPERFEAWLAHGDAHPYEFTATGRRLKGKALEDPLANARALARALLPLEQEYVLPHFRSGLGR